jgi:hypothetical protein
MERELNPFYSSGGLPSDQIQVEQPKEKKSIVFGDSGSNWRMMKLKRVYEISEREARKVEDVALERYGVSLSIILR